jgi:hypothetical protein
VNDRGEAKELVKAKFKEKWKTGFDYNNSRMETFTGEIMRDELKKDISFQITLLYIMKLYFLAPFLIQYGIIGLYKYIIPY